MHSLCEFNVQLQLGKLMKYRTAPRGAVETDIHFVFYSAALCTLLGVWSKLDEILGKWKSQFPKISSSLDREK